MNANGWIAFHLGTRRAWNNARFESCTETGAVGGIAVSTEQAKQATLGTDPLGCRTAVLRPGGASPLAQSLAALCYRRFV